MKNHWMKKTLAALSMSASLLGTPFATQAGERLDDAARLSLLQTGEARQFVKLPLGTMHVRVLGPADGPVVLLVHGGVIGGFAFEKWQRPLVDAGYRVVIPDLLGYGFSDRPDMNYDRDFYAAQIAQLLDALDIRAPVDIVGASLGGAVVTAFAASHPQRLRSVVLVAPAGGGRVQVVNGALLWPVVGDAVFHFFGNRNMRGMMADAYAGSPDGESLNRWMQAQTRYDGFASGILNTLRHYDAAWQPDDYKALGRSGLPVLAVWGTEDKVNPIAQAAVLSEAVPQMKLAKLEGKGHAITFGEAPAVLAAALPFMQAQQRQGR
ncbi:alpha/beta hydrolase [Variovorax sp. ZS18.2.2]|uniref:alpha/beta fold hydrolase n=1 Tax=Variovorax sp. ZS18.2.2 TaxID=2971255 RepID=UPI0021507BA1|nr:alpha/beta hydrolase [Variovorax sp. ZS18.2.2]MCR6478194.1 alpha/beta hydrolase [Variovorax sp. ZS18.2.2]